MPYELFGSQFSGSFVAYRSFGYSILLSCIVLSISVTPMPPMQSLHRHPDLCNHLPSYFYHFFIMCSIILLVVNPFSIYVLQKTTTRFYIFYGHSTCSQISLAGPICVARSRAIRNGNGLILELASRARPVGLAWARPEKAWHGLGLA